MPSIRAAHHRLPALLTLPLLLAACGGGGASSTGGGGQGTGGDGAGGGSGGAGGASLTATVGTGAGGDPATGVTSVTASASSGGMLCQPGEMVPCYSGPAGTSGVGICKMGNQTCSEDGLTLGPCQGEAVPGVENCLSPGDEDCDGAAPA